MSTLKIAAIPLNIAWADPAENLTTLQTLLSKLQGGTDLVVLPELFSTGYIQDINVLNSLAEQVSGSTLMRLIELARKYQVAIAGSILCKAADKLYNRAFFIEPSGEEMFYDKHHLFSLSQEHEVFTKGAERSAVVRYRGFNISMIVCYDLRFPVWCRNTRQAYDIMLVPANWPSARGYAWKQLLIARAIENQAIYVGANRGGSDDFGDYSNLTFIADAAGKIISLDDPATGIIYATVDSEKLHHLRTKLPFANDADDFTL